MAEVVCNNIQCRYIHSGVYCGKDFITINGFAQCSEWYNKKGQVEPQPYITDDKKMRERMANG